MTRRVAVAPSHPLGVVRRDATGRRTVATATHSDGSATGDSVKTRTYAHITGANTLTGALFVHLSLVSDRVRQAVSARLVSEGVSAASASETVHQAAGLG